LETLALEPVYFNIDGAITDFYVSHDTLLIAGPFANVNSAARSTVAMVNKNTFAVLPWTAPLSSIFMVQFPSVSSSARLVRMHQGNVLLGGWFGPNTGQSVNSITAYFDANTGERLPEFNVPVQGNIVYVRNWEQRGNLLYIVGNYFNSTGPTTGALCAVNLSNGQFINQNVTPPGGIAGATDFAIYNNLVITVGEYSSMNGDMDYRYCTCWDMGCAPGSLSIPAAVNLCIGDDLAFSSSWDVSLPDSYQWEWSNDGGASWSLLESTTAIIQIPEAGMEYDGAQFRVLAMSECDTAFSNVAVIDILSDQQIGASISDASVCPGGIVVFNAPFDVQWSNGATSGTPFVLNAPGEGFAVASSNVSCFVPDTVFYVVNENPLLNYTVLDSVNCNLQSGALMLSGSAGQVPYTYLNSNNTIISAVVLNATSGATYTVRDANYCTAQVTAELPIESICFGCMDSSATNYNPQAVFEGNCEYFFTSCDYDLSGDGVINVADLTVLLNNFGCVGLDCESDLDGDQVVGVNDIYFIIQFFNYSCE
jgi:hypothetical protein